MAPTSAVPCLFFVIFPQKILMVGENRKEPRELLNVCLFYGLPPFSVTVMNGSKTCFIQTETWKQISGKISTFVEFGATFYFRQL